MAAKRGKIAGAFDSALAMARGLRERRFTSVELTRFHLERIARLDERYNSFITVTEARALREAEAADRRLADGTAGPLTGVPIAHKDVFCTEGVLTTCGSRMLSNFVAPYDATVVARLEAAGAVMLGKTNMDEFAMGSSTETSWYGPARNPWDEHRVPGGSSGGSAAAVAAGLVAAATGTDTGGSIRQPAAFCGVCGLKPTYGRVSRHGLVAFASSLDQAGVFARDVEDVAVLLGTIHGHDPRDSTSVDRPDPKLAGYVAGSPMEPSTGAVIGWPTEYFAHVTEPRLAQCFAEARRTLEGCGVRFVDVHLPRTDAAIPTYYVLASAEASANLARYDGVRYGHRCADPKNLDDLYRRSRREGFGREVVRRVLTGTYALSYGYYDAYYTKAQAIRRLIRDEFLAAFERVDAILAPTAPNPAFELGALRSDPVQMYRQDVFTIPASLAGLPALAVPCGFIDGLPVGFQLLGPHFGEATLIEIACAFQRETDWHRRHPAGADA